MVDPISIEFITQTGFAIAVTCYLLYERAKFNEKVSECLVKVTAALERIESRMK